MDPQRDEVHRSPIAVEAGILHVLEVGTELQPYRRLRERPRPLRAVVGLEDLLDPVVEPPVTEQKTRAAGRQVIAMRSG